jgi:bacterioferritin (cytochrome b1)
MYEMMCDWVEQDDETDETEKYKSELRQAEQIGDKIEQKLFNRINLQLFEQRLNNFKSLDEFDQECWQLASKVFVLFTEYPTTSIFRNAPISEQARYNEDNENEIIGMEKYISFVADTKGWLYENLSESINNEFNEYAAMAEPTISNHFDGSEITSTNLDFESRLFPILNDLCSLLDEYKTTAK